MSMRSGASVSQLLADDLAAARRADDGGHCRCGSWSSPILPVLAGEGSASSRVAAALAAATAIDLA